jgi:hypothetical protein
MKDNKEEIISEEELNELEQRRKDILSGKSKAFSWEEAKKIILGLTKFPETSLNEK